MYRAATTMPIMVIVTTTDTRLAHSPCDSSCSFWITEAACGTNKDPTRITPMVTDTMVMTVDLTSMTEIILIGIFIVGIIPIGILKVNI